MSTDQVLDMTASGAQHLTQSPQIVPVKEMPNNQMEEFEKILKSFE